MYQYINNNYYYNVNYVTYVLYYYNYIFYYYFNIISFCNNILYLLIIDYNKLYIYIYIHIYIDYIIFLVIYYITKTEHLYQLKHSLETALSPSLSSVYCYFTYMIGLTNGHMSHQKCSMLHFVTASFDSIGVVRNSSTQCAA